MSHQELGSAVPSPNAAMSAYAEGNNQGDVLSDIWRKTVGKKEPNGYPSEPKSYMQNELKFKQPAPETEREILASLINKEATANGVGTVSGSQINRTVRAVHGMISIPNFMVLRVKFVNGKEFTMNFYYGLNPEPVKQVHQWSISRWLSFQTRMTESDPAGIVFLDIHYSNADSPLRWSKEKLLKHGIEILTTVDPTLVGAAPRYRAHETSVKGETLEPVIDAEYQQLLVMQEILKLSFAGKQSLVYTLYGADALAGSHPDTRNRDIVVMLNRKVQSDPESVKRAMVGKFPAFLESMQFAEINGTVKFEDNQWHAQLSGGGDEYTVIEDTFIPEHQQKNIDKIVHLANILYGKTGQKGLQLELIQSVLGVSKGKNAKIPQPEAGDIVQPGVASEDVEQAQFRLLMKEAFEEGYIIVNKQTKRCQFNPVHNEEDVRRSLPGGFRPDASWDKETYDMSVCGHMTEQHVQNVSKRRYIRDRILEIKASKGA